MDDRTRQVLEELAEGRIPRPVAVDCEYAAELERLTIYFADLHRFTQALCRGDLSLELLSFKGPLAGSLKGLQANLRHLTWQAKQIASGDYTQRVVFMGEFAEAFNTMVEGLESTRYKLMYIGTHDNLTGLYNRAYFNTEFDRQARGRRFPVSFIMADVNGLKQVNDGRGHAVGDELIRKAADLLKVAMRADDIIARIGGDEFAAILPGVDAEIAATILGRIRSSMERQDGNGPLVSFAVGVGTALNAAGMKQALQEADESMYRDKAEFKRGTTGQPNADS